MDLAERPPRFAAKGQKHRVVTEWLACYVGWSEKPISERVKCNRMDDVPVFTSQKREQICGELVAAAKADSRIGGAAHLGSAALGLEDRWSDIDLALCLAPDADLNQLLLDWTTRLYRDHGAVTNYDVRRGDILYRVFLLDNTLQVDLSFWPAREFACDRPKIQTDLWRR